MTHMITRCPACGTCFRITEAQLNTAKGAVRCGSCLQIFKALDHRVDGPGKVQQAAATPRRPAASPSKTSRSQTGHFQPSDTAAPSLGPLGAPAPAPAAEALIEDDDILISDDMPLGDEDEEQTSLFDDDLSTSFLNLDGWKPSHTSLFEREPKVEDEEDDDESGKDDADESWAISLLEDDSDEEVGEPKEEPEATRSSAAPAPAPIPQPSPAATPEPQPESAAAINPEPELGPALDEFDRMFDGEGENLVRERRHLLSSIQPEPVEFSIYQGRNWRATLLWGGLSLLGLLALIGQIGWLQFDSLSRHQPYRSIYMAVCPVLKCQVPALAAPELIRTSNLVVRSHPQAEGALVVDTILLNTASFRQPYPELTLTFSNRHGETVASRRFVPGEYLAGEVAGHSLMPSNQPIHLTLEILDPGPDAVSYSVYIPH